MIPEYHLYHGAFLACLISGAGKKLTISSPESSRPAEYVLNENIGLYVKHATQRLRPWHFGFTPDNIQNIRSLRLRFSTSFLVLVCRQDGLIAVDLNLVIANISPAAALWIRANREKRKLYRLHGPMGEFPMKFDSNLLAIKSLLEAA